MPTAPLYPDESLFVPFENAEQALNAIDPSLHADELREVISSAYKDHAANGTCYAPRSFVKEEMYQHTSMGIRTRMSEDHNWYQTNKKNFALIHSPNGSISIACKNGGPGTGRQDGTPRLTHMGKAAIEACQQERLPGFDLDDPRNPTGLWYLLTHVDQAHNIVRAELSHPVVNAENRLVGWDKRISLEPIELTSPIDPKSSTIQRPEIPVARKKA